MTDWFNEQNDQETGNGGQPSETSSGTPAYGDAGWSSTGREEAAPPPAAPEEPPVPLTGAADSAPTAGEVPPPSRPPYQAPAAPLPAAYSVPQGSYDPYGWQQMPVRPPQPPKKKKSGTGLLIGILAGVSAVTIITLSVLLAVALSDKTPPVDSSSVPTSSAQGGTASRPNREPNESAPSLDITQGEAGSLSTREIAERNYDSAVVLKMYEKTESYLGGDADYQEVGEASGIVMTEDGYIITNRHCVINESTNAPYGRVSVTMYDGTIYDDAEIIGSDQYTDLAVIKVNTGGTSLKPATFGNSSDIFVGDRVIAMGNAGGLSWTVTQGILSGISREVYRNTEYAIKCLQVDAAINPGNSGGPLFNSQGLVIGINSAKIAQEDYEGLGFAIPINEAKPVIDDLLKYGYVKGRVMLSITGQSFSSPGYDSGFRILSINSDSVFVGTQVKVGDIITHIAGVRVKDADELSIELSKHKVGEAVEITLNRIDRNRQETTIKVTVTLREGQSN